MSFVIGESQLGSFDPDTQVLAADDVAETNFCPVNGIQASSDCAVVTMTSSSNDVVGDLIASATINGITITDTEIVTNTGIKSGGPDQNSFTITRLTDAGLNHATNAVVAIEGDVLNNEEKRIRVDLADFFNNPVPDGTLVEFTTELGDITPSCRTVSGQCDVTFTSADPRKPDNTQVSFRNLVMVRRYVPGRGHIIFVDFDPASGHEQALSRPALVLSVEAFNRRIRLALVAPITRRIRGHGFEVHLNGTKTHGAVLCQQIKIIDYRARGARYIEDAPDDIVQDTLAKVRTIVA